MKRLDSLHPLSMLIYFICVIFITMFTQNPLLIGISFGGALLYKMITEKNRFFASLWLYLFMFVVVAAVNPIFNHRGATILFFLNDNAVTLEAIVYGFMMAGMMVCVFIWFSLFSRLMTSDKLLFLFGKIAPKLSVVISSSLRFVPMFIYQMKKVTESQRTLCAYNNKNLISNIKSAVNVFSIMTSWSFENAIDTADSMRARGYGLKNRSNYSVFEFTAKDFSFTLLCIVLTAIVSLAGVTKDVYFSYYPQISEFKITSLSITAYIAFSILAILPTYIELKEDIKWIYYKSKI